MTEDILGEEPFDWPITIGVALPIPEPFLGELGAYRERFGDPLAHAIVAHITLVPPTEVANEVHVAAIVDHLRTQAAALKPFDMVLAGAGTFRPLSQVVFVPIEQGEDEVRATEEMIRRGPLDRPLAFPYHPHVTIAHGLDEAWLDQAHAAMQSYRAAFEVDRLALFRKGVDGVWRPWLVFPFGGQPRDLQRHSDDAVAIEVVDPADFPARCDRLGEILADSVASGANVDFLLPFSAADAAAWWRAQAGEVESGRRIVLVAHQPGALVGTISICPASAPNGAHRAELSKLLVDPADRRRGIATALIAAAESHARSRGLRLLVLDCVAGGPVEALHRGLGYVPVGTVPGYALSPTGEPEDAMFMYLALPSAAQPNTPSGGAGEPGAVLST